MELQACSTDTFSCSKVVGRLAVILFFAILQRFLMGLRSIRRQDLASQDRTCIPYVVNCLSEFGIMGKSQVVLECELVTSKELLSCRKQKMLQDFLDTNSDICSQKTQRSNSADDIPPHDVPRPWCCHAGYFLILVVRDDLNKTCIKLMRVHLVHLIMWADSQVAR